MPLEHFGLLKTSLIDFPGEIASVVFTAGCNLGCPYCHNPGLVPGSIPDDFLPRETVLSFLSKRRTVLGGVCITGGQPLTHRDLPLFIRDIHALGLKVKLDTNGTLPDLLSDAGADYIAMDLKTSPSKYGMLGLPATGVSDSPVAKSVDILVGSGIPHHFRITLVPGIVEALDLEIIAGLLPEGEKVTVSQFRPETTLSPEYRCVVPYTKTAAQGLLSCFQLKGIRTEMIGF